MTDLSARRAHPVAGLAAFLVVVAAVAVVGSLSAVSAASDYAALRQPSWAPPSWLFGPVWTVLYVMIAFSGWLAWRAGSRRGLVLFGAQLVLNAAWTPLFFAAGEFGLALVDIVLLLVCIVAVIVVFARRSRVAAGLLVPYLLWVGFATALNASIWTAN
ncbi:TspO/MBR family protein [Umezawaea sp. Da 62-37]|uniref:TspO/MBR family protein n=1 Tax=Umezawaea sp. Da 62-37 TaxID=3075927 RepID=UPI0028F70F90|nr:TspO/MBR family protein [Umezawaea sp. Da 62-37]WNV88875.1 TspO/MBR family protein [Umezawaea sp. Da 62-37]